jgi:hypothetical protein
VVHPTLRADDSSPEDRTRNVRPGARKPLSGPDWHTLGCTSPVHDNIHRPGSPPQRGRLCRSFAFRLGSTRWQLNVLQHYCVINSAFSALNTYENIDIKTISVVNQMVGEHIVIPEFSSLCPGKQHARKQSSKSHIRQTGRVVVRRSVEAKKARYASSLPPEISGLVRFIRPLLQLRVLAGPSPLIKIMALWHWGRGIGDPGCPIAGIVISGGHSLDASPDCLNVQLRGSSARYYTHGIDASADFLSVEYRR